MRKVLKRSLVLLPGLIGGFLACLLIPLADPLERTWWDWEIFASLRLKRAQYRRIVPKFVLVEIDETSLHAMKKWPIDRKNYAHLLDVLDSGDARAIIFDLIFSEPSTVESDSAFAKALSRKTNRFVAFHHIAEGEKGEPSWGVVVRDSVRLQSIFPCQVLRDAVGGRVGFADVIPDSDGTVRRVQLYRMQDKKPELALGLVAAHELLGYPVSERPECVPEKYCLGPIRIPVEPGGQTRLAVGFYPEEINHIPISQALALSAEEAKDYFRDRIIYVAATAEGIRDTATLPVLGTVPAVFLHIQVQAQILAHRFFRTLLPGSAEAGLILVFGILLGTVFLRLPLFKALMIFLAVAGGLLLLSSVLLVFLGQVFSSVGFLLSLVFTSVLTTLWRAFSAEIHRTRAGALLRQFLPPVIAEYLLSRKTHYIVKKECQASILFCDIRQFTTLSERLPALEMMTMVDAFHKAMERIFSKHGGIAMDYQGDAEMIIFGAPETQEDHALRAVRAAIEMQLELDRLRKDWDQEGRPVFEMGTGICTGQISLGLVGGPVRKQYTAIGDVTNTAARLQALSAELKSPVLVSESTYEEVKHDVWASPLGERQLKGKAQPVTIYRINGLKEDERRLRILKVRQDDP